jgi:hypothetical protein
MMLEALHSSSAMVLVTVLLTMTGWLVSSYCTPPPSPPCSSFPILDDEPSVNKGCLLPPPPSSSLSPATPDVMILADAVGLHCPSSMASVVVLSGHVACCDSFRHVGGVDLDTGCLPPTPSSALSSTSPNDLILADTVGSHRPSSSMASVVLLRDHVALDSYWHLGGVDLVHKTLDLITSFKKCFWKLGLPLFVFDPPEDSSFQRFRKKSRCRHKSIDMFRIEPLTGPFGSAWSTPLYNVSF